MVAVNKESGFKQTEVGLIPNDWIIKRLSDINSKKFPGINPMLFPEETFEYYSIPAYQESGSPIDEKGKNILSSKILLDNKVVLFGRLNPRVEKVWLINSNTTKRKIGSGEWITVLPDNERIISDYIYHLIWSKYVMPVAKEFVTGSTPSRQRIIPYAFYNIKVPLPATINEQTAIATAINDVDALIENLEKIIPKKQNIKQGVMKQLLTPKESWEVKRLEEICSEIGDGIHTTPNYISESEYFFINGNNLLNGKIIIFNDTNCVSKYEFEQLKKKLGVQTILMSINGTIGNLALYNNEKVVLGKSAAYINLKYDIEKRFIYYVLQHSSVKQFYNNELTGTTIRNLSLKSIRETPIHLPEKSEQTTIADILSDIDNDIEALEKKLHKYKMIKQGMMQALLTGKIRLI